MKFKAFLTDTGVQLLEKRVLPALEKMGRSCHVDITPSHFCFLHNLLFSEYRFSSQTDKISFSLSRAAPPCSSSTTSPCCRASSTGLITAQARTQRALQRGDAMTVQLSVKHFYKALQCHLAKPDSAYFGIAAQGSCLTVIFDFFISGTRIRDNAISFYCRLPVLDTGST